MLSPRPVIAIDPRKLLVPSNMGADPYKLQKQIAKYGNSIVGMPLLVGYETLDGFILLFDGITRATRVAKLLPGRAVQVQIAGKMKVMSTKYHCIEETIP